MKTLHKAILSAYSVPPLMIGNAPEPRGPNEAADFALAMTDAAGFDPYLLPAPVQDAALRRYVWWLGL